MQRLPIELVEQVLPFLEQDDLVRFSETCRTYRDISFPHVFKTVYLCGTRRVDMAQAAPPMSPQLRTVGDLRATFTEAQRARIGTFKLDLTTYGQILWDAEGMRPKSRFFADTARQAIVGLLEGLADNKALTYIVNLGALRLDVQKGVLAANEFLAHLSKLARVNLVLFGASNHYVSNQFLLEEQCTVVRDVLSAVKDVPHVGLHLDLHCLGGMPSPRSGSYVISREAVIRRILSPTVSTLSGLRSAQFDGEASLLYRCIAHSRATSLSHGKREWKGPGLRQASMPPAVLHLLGLASQTLRTLHLTFTIEQNRTNIDPRHIIQAPAFPLLPKVTAFTIETDYKVSLDAVLPAKMPRLQTLVVDSGHCTCAVHHELGHRLQADPKMYLPDLKAISLKSRASSDPAQGLDELLWLSTACTTRGVQLHLGRKYYVNSLESGQALTRILVALSGTNHLERLDIEVTGDVASEIMHNGSITQESLQDAGRHEGLTSLSLALNDPVGIPFDYQQSPEGTLVQVHRQAGPAGRDFFLHVLRDLVGHAPQLRSMHLSGSRSKLSLVECSALSDFAGLLAGGALPNLRKITGTLSVPYYDREEEVAE